MRSVFQHAPEVSLFFMGSKRSLMNSLVADRRRPFYNVGRRIELGRLAWSDLGDFVSSRFAGSGRGITPQAVDVLLYLVDGHPYRAQQLASHTWERATSSGPVDEDTVLAANEAALDETEAEFRAILDGMPPARRAVCLAICREPTAEPHSRPYLIRHGTRGSESYGTDSGYRVGHPEPAGEGSRSVYRQWRRAIPRCARDDGCDTGHPESV